MSRISDRLRRLEAMVPPPPAAPSEIFAAFCQELDAYCDAKASTAVHYRWIDGGLVPIDRARTVYHFDAAGSSVLAEAGRLAGVELPDLHAEAWEPANANP